jgi:hypothetical protein
VCARNSGELSQVVRRLARPEKARVNPQVSEYSPKGAFLALCFIQQAFYVNQ